MYYDYFVSDTIYQKLESHTFRCSLLAAFTCLNLLIPIMFVLLGTKCNQKLNLSTSSQWVGVSWGFIVAAAVHNTAAMCGHIVILYTNKNEFCIITPGSCVIPTHTQLYTDELATFLVKATLIPSAIIMELLISIRMVHMSYRNANPLVVEKLLLKYRCCPYRRYPCLRRILETLVLWNMMIFVQSLGMVAFPACIFLIISPTETISVLGSAALIFTIFVLVTAYILRLGKHCKYKLTYWKVSSCGAACAKLSVFVVILVLGVAIGFIYFNILNRRGRSEGVEGLGLPLLPSIIASLLLWLIKRKVKGSRRSVRQNENWQEQHQIPLSDLADEERSLLQPDHESVFDNSGEHVAI